MTKETFLEEINAVIKNRPSEWRKGQTVFNYINEKYGVARTAQFEYGVDCFYMDDKIPDFIDLCYKLIEEKDEQQ